MRNRKGDNIRKNFFDGRNNRACSLEESDIICLGRVKCAEEGRRLVLLLLNMLLGIEVV